MRTARGRAGHSAVDLIAQHVPASDRARQALAISSSRRMRMETASIFAEGHEEQRAQALLNTVLKEAPDFEFLKFLVAPMLQARIALNHRDPQKAIELLKLAAAYDGNFSPALFLRATAYLDSGRGADAAHEFQRILQLRTVDPVAIYVPLARLGLARAHALSGDKEKARGAYQDFFALWKDADPDIPILEQAKAEYAKLR